MLFLHSLLQLITLGLLFFVVFVQGIKIIHLICVLNSNNRDYNFFYPLHPRLILKLYF